MPECQEKVLYRNRYKMRVQCAKEARNYSYINVIVQGHNKCFRTLHTGNEVDPATGHFTSGLETIEGRGLAFEECIRLLSGQNHQNLGYTRHARLQSWDLQKICERRGRIRLIQLVL
jgi:hypothetical protein